MLRSVDPIERVIFLTAHKALRGLELKEPSEEPVVQPCGEPNLDRASVVLRETKDLAPTDLQAIAGQNLESQKEVDGLYLAFSRINYIQEVHIEERIQFL